MSFDGEEVRALGFKEVNSPIKVVQGLSWIMSRIAPTLIAIDQIDAIVTASSSLARAANSGAMQEQMEAQSIVDALAQGLMDLHEYKRRALESTLGLSPRELLQACDRHQRKCVAAGEVTLCKSFDPTQPPSREDETAGLDQVYQSELKAAVIANLIDAEGEDQFRELIDGTLRLLEKHYDLPDDIDSEVQHDPDQKRPSLHGRLSFTFLSEGSREQHYCFRLLGHTNARAFQTRLKAAMTASGIDTALKFRHLFILRGGAPPSGPRTKALFDQFLKAGGKLIAPTDDDLRAFVALAAMDARKLTGFDAWLRQQQPLFKTPLFQEAGLCPPPFLASNRSPPRACA
ncbi:MAG: hypothetical protein WA624_01220, partial [Methylocella sp.]